MLLRAVSLFMACCVLPGLALAQDSGAQVRISGGAKGKPFLILLPGSGGGIPGHWASAASGSGYAVVAVNIAGMFPGRSLLAVSEQEQTAGVTAALEAARKAGLSPDRYAILGLSKGGTTALVSAGAARSAGYPAPAAVFAFYPGSVGWCPNSHGGTTRVHIFYGDADGWGNHRGTREACKRQAGGAVQFHEYPGVHHNFDVPGGRRQGGCCGTSWISEFNGAAAANARGVVTATLRAIR